MGGVSDEYPVTTPMVIVVPLMAVMIELAGIPVPLIAWPTAKLLVGATFVICELAIVAVPESVPV